MAIQNLTHSERCFLELVSRATFANPFSEEREVLDLEISGLSKGASRAQCIDATLVRVRAFLSELEKAGRADVGGYEEGDRVPLLHAHLFDIFHQFVDEFDRLIQQQARSGDSLCPVMFWRDVAGTMVSCGVPKEDAGRYFAMFYQLRRAYHFIHGSLVGRSPSMRRLRLALWNNVFTHDMRLYERYLWSRMEDFSTLILGETGTGKGAAAAAIGRSGFIPFDEKRQCFVESFTRSFMSMNLSQFSEPLIESELFGHRKGAFTGAVESHEGAFSRCSPHGAIFLDEIGDVAIPVQIKLLQVLQERMFSPVGSHERLHFRGRVIAATNRAMDRLRGEGLLRDDFFYRLCSDVIAVPPLRQRMEEDAGELDELIAMSLRRILGQESAELAALVRSVLDRDLGPHYGWPGNVRELEQAVRRIILTRAYGGDRVSVSPGLKELLDRGIREGSYDADHLLADYCALLHGRHGTFEDVARVTRLDRRTARKYVMMADPKGKPS